MSENIFDSGSYDSAYRDYPKCEFWDIHTDLDHPNQILRVDDPKTKNLKEDLFKHKMALDHHYFDEVGFPFCKRCGWNPLLVEGDES